MAASVATETERDRRKTTRLFENWESHRQLDVMPAWRLRARVSNGDLRNYCIGGRVAAEGPDGANDEMGGIFRESLGTPAAGSNTDSYAAAVLMGIFLQLGASLPDRPRPLFDKGKFPTPDFGLILYRLVVLPFARDLRRVDHWLALGIWRADTPLHEAG